MSLDALQDLFSRVREASTGVWRLGQDPQRSIFLEHGLIVFAQSTHPLDRLTHLLVEKGKLTQAQMDYAMDNLAPGLSIGRNLIQMGFITQRDLLDVARFQVERVVWGALGSEGATAAFEEKELDNSVVRLALDTPAMLLSGLLNLRDRERMLDLLGPLEQVLEILNPPPESCLPGDLMKVPAFFDGRRSLLELAREAGAEPMRMGALALFLKELHWARPVETPAHVVPSTPAPTTGAAILVEAPLLLVEAPGIALTLPMAAVRPEDEDTLAARKPSLIEHIQAAQLPTANLDHMAEQLDRMTAPAAPAPRPDPASRRKSPPLLEASDDDEITAENAIPAVLPEIHEDQAWHVEEGQALLPEPVGQTPFESPEPIPLLVEPLFKEPEPFPLPPGIEAAPEAGHPSAAPDFEARRRSSKGPWIVGFGLVAALAAVLGWWTMRDTSVPGQVAPGAPAAVSSPLAPVPSPVQATPAASKPETPAEPVALPPPVKTEPVPKSPSAEEAKASPEQRWATLKAGKLEVALAQGRAHLKTLKANRWSLRLEIACQVETLQNAAVWMEGRRPDLFVLPMAMKNRQTCNQLFSGSYASREEAEAQIPKLPPPFREGGNKPRAFQISEIPVRQ